MTKYTINSIAISKKNLHCCPNNYSDMVIVLKYKCKLCPSTSNKIYHRCYKNFNNRPNHVTWI